VAVEPREKGIMAVMEVMAPWLMEEAVVVAKMPWVK
jgi:hypothetical protein